MARNKKKQNFIIIGSLAVVIAAGIGIGAYYGRTSDSIQGAAGLNNLKDANYNAADSGKKVITLKTDTKLNCSSTPWVIAEKKGFFAAEGLEIKYTGELKTEQKLPAILNGTNDIGATLPNTLATYVAGGANVKAVTLGEVDPPDSVDPIFRHMRYVTSEKFAGKTLKEYVESKKGGKITVSGTAPNCSTFIFNEVFRNAGLDPSQIQYVAFESDTAAIQAVQQGSLDVAGIHPPFYKLANDSKLTVLADSHDTGLGAASGASVYYFTDKFIQENPEAVQRFVNAIKKAQDWVNHNTDESIKLTAEYIGQPVNATHYYFTDKGLPTELFQPWIDDLVQSGTIKKDQVKTDDIVTTQFSS
ncbi:ABC transporter substrate-binding protein [Paenibacillus apii]|uniref:ABC transporter substrate-binding protein n=1 Tax=Paenibacillus apii TaxID=1850370 RepID=UPI001439AA9C|nr:ABC transporter substrate-binding protein [Paenibacillus apii]NJJ40761.1 ABC transporter substrate-binding protein [Paenibacillus apii]